MEPLPEHLVGAGLVGFAVLNWFALREPGTGPCEPLLLPMRPGEGVSVGAVSNDRSAPSLLSRRSRFV